VIETDNVLAFHHTRPFWPVHIVVIPRRHINSLLALEPGDDQSLIEIFDVVKKIAAQVVAERGGAHILTNLGEHQDSKHLHFHKLTSETLYVELEACAFGAGTT
jgi:histidine triad (HIT) family protein